MAVNILEKRDEILEQKRARAKKAVTEKPKSAKTKKPTKKQLQINDMASHTVMPDNYFTVWTTEQLEEMCAWMRQQPVLAIDTETLGVNPFADMIVGFSVYAKSRDGESRGYYVPLMHNEHLPNLLEVEGDIGTDYVHCLPNVVVADAIRPILENPELKLLLHNAKFDMHVLRRWLKIKIKPYFDTMIGQALLDETQSKRLKDMATFYLKIPSDRFSTLFGKITFEKVPIRMNLETRTGNLASYYAIKDTFLTWDMAAFQMRALNRPELAELKKLLFEIEMPFLQIVANAEWEGVALDVDYLENRVAVDLRRELEELRLKIWAYTGEINLNAPAQVAEAIYVKLGLPRVNEDKPNSTDKRTLGKLKKKHEVVGMILDYKQKVKLVTAFADKLPKAVVEGRVHTSFNSVGTKTGRMSSSSPNLQQMPARVGGLIRNAFVADDGRLLVSIDFSSQELRWLAHISKDETLLDIYKRGLDVHSMTAMGMWNQNYPSDQVTYEDFEYRRKSVELFVDPDGNIEPSKTSFENITVLFHEGKIKYADPEVVLHDVELGKKYEKYRKDAKVVNFGIIYGMSEYKLADTLEISVDDARSYIDAYFARYPGVKRWMAEMRKQMDKVMYTKTFLGRKRRVHQEMMSDKMWMRGSGYRMGINAVIQGSSADQVKLASIALQPYLESIDAHIVLWVHDEIIFSVPASTTMEQLQGIADIMCNAVILDCGMKSDIEVGQKWGQKMSEDDMLRNLLEDDEEDDDE
jgi:DNA polymerase-1